MTLGELNEHYRRREKLIKAQELLESIRLKAQPGAQVLTGMPHTTGVKDRVGDLAVEIIEMENKIDLLKTEIAESEKPIVKFIVSIDDDRTRMIFRLRFIHCLSWKEIADVIGGWSTAANVKSALYRYLKTNHCDGEVHNVSS